MSKPHAGSLSSPGNEFRTVGPAIENARRPNVLSRQRCTISWCRAVRHTASTKPKTGPRCPQCSRVGVSDFKLRNPLRSRQHLVALQRHRRTRRTSAAAAAATGFVYNRPRCFSGRERFNRCCARGSTVVVWYTILVVWSWSNNGCTMVCNSGCVCHGFTIYDCGIRKSLGLPFNETL